MACDRVYVQELPANSTEASLRQVFGPYGTIKAIKLLPKKPGDKGASALIGFAEKSEAEWVVENLDGNCAEGLMEPIKCQYGNAAAAAAAATGGAGGGAQKGGGGGNGCGGGCAGGMGGCGMGGYGKGGCGMGGCGMGGGGAAAWGGNPNGGDKWACEACGFFNKPANEVCGGTGGKLGCKAPNPNPVPAGGGGGGDWGGGGGGCKGAGPYGGCGGGGGGWGGGGKGGGKMMGMMGQMMGAPDMASLVNMMSRMQPGGQGGKPTDAQQVQVKQLPADCTDFDLYKLCSPYGAIPPKGVKAMLTPEGQCTGIGWVDFIEEDSAAACCQALSASGVIWAQQKKTRAAPQAL